MYEFFDFLVRHKPTIEFSILGLLLICIFGPIIITIISEYPSEKEAKKNIYNYFEEAGYRAFKRGEPNYGHGEPFFTRIGRASRNGWKRAQAELKGKG